MLPVDAETTALAPSSTAMEMAMVMPRSLKLPVGLAPSTFSHTSAPTRSERRGAGSSGVPPSSRVTTGVFSVMGRRSRYSSMTPRQPAVTARSPVSSARSPMTRSTPLTRSTAWCRRNSSMVASRSPSRATWVRKISRASSARPTCSMARMETSWSPKILATAARTPGRSATSMLR